MVASSLLHMGTLLVLLFSANMVLQGVNALTLESLTCIPASSLGWKESYGAATVPQSGTLTKVTLKYVEGFVAFCATTPYQCSQGKFGWGPAGLGTAWPGLTLAVYVTRSDPKVVMYPVAGQTTGYQDITTAPGFYWMHPYKGTDPTITFNGPSQPVRQGEILKFFMGEVLESINYGDNRGTTCATVQLTYAIAPQAPVAAQSLTCIPSAGRLKSVYGAARIPSGGQLQKITLNYVSGGAQFCAPTQTLCSPGTFGWGINGLPASYPPFALGVYVTRSSQTVMFPQAGTAGYRSLPYAYGFYEMSPYKGSDNSITFDGPAQSVSSGEILKFYFGEVLQSINWGDNKGTTCAAVSTTYVGPQPSITPPGGLPTLPAGSCRGFEAVCTCLGDVMCKTFDGYEYAFEHTKGYYLVSGLPGPSTSPGWVPFSISAYFSPTATASSVVKYVRVRLIVPNPIDIDMFVGNTSASSRRAFGSATFGAVQPGVENLIRAGSFYLVHRDNQNVLLMVRFGPITSGIEDLYVRVSSSGEVAVHLSDCYMRRVSGMCGGFGGHKANDAMYIKSVIAPGTTFKDKSLLGSGVMSRSASVILSSAGMEKLSGGLIGVSMACAGLAAAFAMLGFCFWRLRAEWKRREWRSLDNSSNSVRQDQNINS